jgi:predicted acyl esterase
MDKFVERMENEWPLTRTQWTKFHLNPADYSLSKEPASVQGNIDYEALGDGVTFMTPPLEEVTEVTGPSAAKLVVSSSTEDADIFLVLRVFTSDMKEVVFQGAVDPHTPIGQGWLRASHRKLDPVLSTEYRPYHSHDEKQSLIPGEAVELDVEIWPTCIVVPAGYRIGLTVRGKDYVYPGGSGGRLSYMKNEFTGCGPFLHNDPRDRQPKIFGGKVTLHISPDQPAYVVLPIIPKCGSGTS